jgi:uncharacterized glyoxalase superfamily protein PhnB
MNQTVIPLLVYNNIQAAHDFLVRAFGFASGGVQQDGNGQAVHGEVRIGETTIWLHRVAKEQQLASSRDLNAVGSGLVVFVDDVDAHCQRARAAGAHIEKAPENTSYGMREYGARDLEGHRWWFEMSLK